MFFVSRTLTYCIWNLMAGDEHQDIKQDRIALPPPTKRRDYHLRMLLIINLIKIFV